MANPPKDNILPFQTSESSQESWLAEVIDVSDRHVRINLRQTDLKIPFTRCSVGLHGLRGGDRVVVRRLDGQLIIESRMMRDDEAPLQIEYNQLGELVVEARQALSLRTPKGELRLDRHGKLYLQGECIDMDAENENHITGTMIKLN